MQSELGQSRWSVEHLITAGLEFMQTSRGVILGLTFMLYLPINIVLSRVPVPDTEKLIEALSLDNPLPLEPYTNYFLILWLISLFESLASYVLAIAVDHHARGQTTTYNEALFHALRRWPVVFLTSLLKLIILIPLSLLIVPGILFGVYWIFSTYAVLLRNHSGMNALRYSRDLIQGAWWHVSGTYFLLLLFGAFASAAVAIVAVLFPEGAIGTVIGGTLGSFIGMLFLSSQVMLFLNMEALATKWQPDLNNLDTRTP